MWSKMAAGLVTRRGFMSFSMIYGRNRKNLVSTSISRQLSALLSTKKPGPLHSPLTPVVATSSCYHSGTSGGILKRLAEGPVIGDGSYVVTLEKRGYVMAGPFTPEAVIEHPYAVTQLHREYIRAGADVVQAFTFYATDGKLDLGEGSKQYTSQDLNQKACDIVKQVADNSNLLICGGISPTPLYKSLKNKEAVQQEYHKQTEIFIENDIDFYLAEFFAYIEDAEWAIEVLKRANKPVACTMRIGPCGDLNDVSPGECAVRMARAGADIVGVNCSFDPSAAIATVKVMKEGLDAEGLSTFLMTQPLGFWTPETSDTNNGYYGLPEFPFALEPRQLTRWDARRYAREAYDAGVRYIGGCCGFEPHHIREMAEELAEERGRRPPGADKNGIFGENLTESVINNHVPTRTGRDYWMNVVPGMGRKDGKLLSTPVKCEY